MKTPDALASLPLGDTLSLALDLASAARYGVRMAIDSPQLIPYGIGSPARMLESRARRNARDLALLYRDERHSWAQVNAHANQYASWFERHGVRPKTVVAIVMDNRPDFLFALLGLSKLGAVGALINTQLVGAALAHAIHVSRAKFLLVGAERRAQVHALEREGASALTNLTVWVAREDGDSDTDPRTLPATIDDEVRREPTRNRLRLHIPSNKDVFCYVYTSGTTGLPKAAVIRNQRMLGANLVFGHLMHRAGPGDVIYVPLPLFHSNALFLGWGSALATGAAIALRRKFSVSQFWDDVRAFDATSFVYIGELCRYLLQAPERPEERQHRLRVAVGNGLRPEIWEKFQKRFSIPMVREFYGSTEGNAPTLNWRGRPGMIGRKLRNQSVIRCDPETGELVRNPRGFCEEVAVGQSGLLVGRLNPLFTFDGYVDAQATEQKILTNVFKRGDRYFNTGDLVLIHEGGWLSFVDRLGDTYRWKGENVSTQEVAEILHRAPGVLDANVFGVTVPNADGRAGMAALRVGPGFTPAKLLHYVKEHLAVAQRPLFVRVLADAMQVTSTLKPKKGEYRAQGYDLKRVRDPIYVLRSGRYVKLTPKLLTQIQAGTIALG